MRWDEYEWAGPKLPGEKFCRFSITSKNTRALQRDPIHIRIELCIIARYELLAGAMRPCQVRDMEDVTQYILESNPVFIVIDVSH
jgi:hypothetical protein